MKMANLRHWLEEAEQECGETILAMVVGVHDGSEWNTKPQPDENVILSRDDGLAKVDEEFSDGYGSADCFPLYAWTASRVFYVHEYDGATGLRWIPRYPVNIAPSF